MAERDLTSGRRRHSAPADTADGSRRRIAALWWVGAVALALTGVGGAAMAMTAPGPLEAEAEGGNTPINAGAGDPTDLTAHNSPSLAHNPTDAANLVAANRIDTPQFSCALHVSRDGGASWSETDVPIPDGEEGPCFAPDVAFDAAGTLYATYVTLEGRGNTPSAVWLVTSDDGGRTVSAPTRIGDDLSFQVQLHADPAEPERLYLTWLDADNVGTLSLPEPGQPIVAATSDDGGRTWSQPVQVNAASHERAVAGSPAIADNGSWYVAYLDLASDRLNYHGAHEGRGGPPPEGPWRLVVARSTDDGATWQHTVVDELVPTERFLVFLPPFPQLAVDDDTVYLTFHDGRANRDGAPSAADVWLWTSDDRGQSWAAPTRVNDNPPDDGTRQYLPQIAAAPNGRIDILYYDRRADPDNVDTETSLQATADGGETFTDRLAVSDEPFDSRIGFGSYRDLPELGTQLALVSTDDHALGVWADTRAGSEASGKQDLTQAVVTFTATPPGPSWAGPALRPLGAAVAIVSVLALVWLIRTRRRHRDPRPANGHDRPAPSRSPRAASWRRRRVSS